jgi:hypothetical protein
MKMLFARAVVAAALCTFSPMVTHSQNVVANRDAIALNTICLSRRPAVHPRAPFSALGTPIFENTSVGERCACMSGNNPAKVQKLFVDGGQPVMESRLEFDQNIENWEEAQ